MKRKVKFQEGGTVEEPARRPAPRSRLSRMSEAARNRFSEARAASQREVERLNAMRDVEEFNRSRQVAEANRRAGLASYPAPGSQDFTTDTRGTTRRGAATGREVVPFQEPGMPATQGGREVGQPRPSASRALANVATPRQIPLGSTRPPVGGNIATTALGLATGIAEPLVEYGRGYMDRRAEERALANVRREVEARNEAPAAAPAPAPAPAPTPAPVRRPAAPAPSEISAERLNQLADGAEPMNRRERDIQMRIMDRRQELEGRGVAFKKGGMVKPKPVAKKAGGMVKSAPKKMMKGGIVAKPKSKAKPSGKPMPAFKKGGMIKKGKK